MMSRMYRRLIALVLVVVMLQAAIPPTAAVAADRNEARVVAPRLDKAVLLATTMGQLRTEIDSLVERSSQKGGLFGWKSQLVGMRDAIIATLPAALQEMEQVDEFTRKQSLPATAQQRAADGTTEVQQRTTELLSHLTNLLHAADHDQSIPVLLKQVQSDLAAWLPPAGTSGDVQLPFGPNANFGAAAVKLPLASSPEPMGIPASSAAATSDDLMRYPQTLLDKLGADGQTPVNILRYVYAYIRLQWYVGSAKRGDTVLAEQAGNDTDIAQLTIALLRERGVPARFAYGTVGLGAADWAAITELTDGEQAARFLVAAGLSVVARTDDKGQIVRLDVPHTWVEAQLSSGGWTALDPSWKSTVPDASQGGVAMQFDLSKYLTKGQGLSPLAFWEGKSRPIVAASGPQTLIPDAPIDDDSALPLVAAATPLAPDALPRMDLTVLRGARSSATMPMEWLVYVRISAGDLQANLPLAELADKRLTLLALSATPNDAAIARTWHGFDGSPLYLQRVRSHLFLDGKDVAAGHADLMPGASIMLQVQLQMGELHEQFTRVIHAGDTFGLTITPQPVAEQVAKDRVDAQGNKMFDSFESLTGTQLRQLGLEYLLRADRAVSLVSTKSGMPIVPGIRAVITSFETKVGFLGDIPVAIDHGGVGIDAVRVANTPVSPKGDTQSERVASVLLGAQESFAEGEAFRSIFWLPGESTISLLQERTAAGYPLKYLCSCDPADPPMNLSAQANAQIAAAVGRGNLAVVPSTPIDDHDVYILLDPHTGASTFAIGAGNEGWFERAWDAVARAKEHLIEDVVEPLLHGVRLASAEVNGLMEGIGAGFVFAFKGEIEGLYYMITNPTETLAFIGAINVASNGNPALLVQMLMPTIIALAPLMDHLDEVKARLERKFDEFLANVSGYKIGSEELGAYKIPFIVGFVAGIVIETQIIAVITDGIGEVDLAPVLARSARLFASVSEFMLDESGYFRIARAQRMASAVAEMGDEAEAAELAAEAAAGVDESVATSAAAAESLAVSTAMAEALGRLSAYGREAASKLPKVLADLQARQIITEKQSIEWATEALKVTEPFVHTSRQGRIMQKVLSDYNARVIEEGMDHLKLTETDVRFLINSPREIMTNEQWDLVQQIRTTILEKIGPKPGGWFRRVEPSTNEGRIFRADRKRPQVGGYLALEDTTEEAQTVDQFMDMLRLGYNGSDFKRNEPIYVIDGILSDAAEFEPLTWKSYPNLPSGFLPGPEINVEVRLKGVYDVLDGSKVTAIIPKKAPKQWILTGGQWVQQ